MYKENAELKYAYIKCSEPVYQDILDMRYDEFFKRFQLPREIITDADEENAYHLVCMEGNKLIGYMRMVVLGKTGHLSQFVVDNAYRGHGIGTKLIRMNEEKAYKVGVKVMELSAKVERLDFYYRLGYSNVGEVFLSKKTGLPHRIVRKTLRKE